MERPNKKDFMTGHPQMDYSTDLAKYYDALEKYADFMETTAPVNIDVGSVVSSKTIHSKLANKHESLKGELNSITNIINGNKGMSSDYILDKTRNIPFLRCKLNLIDEILGD